LISGLRNRNGRGGEEKEEREGYREKEWIEYVKYPWIDLDAGPTRG